MNQTKYLICSSKARALGISRETYVAFVESQGYTYSNATHADDSYGYISHADGRYALVVDINTPYYANFPDILKSRLVDRETMKLDGWFPVEEIVE